MPNSKGMSLQRFAIEVVVIVSSILLAFAIDAWWDERQERIEEKEILLGLKSEFSRYREDLADGIRNKDYELHLVGELLAAVRRGSWDSDSLSIDEAVVELTNAQTHDFGGGVLDALISAGQLEIISDYDLRLQLASWSEVFREFSDDELRNQYIAKNLAMPYMLRRQLPQSGGFELCCSWSNWPVPVRWIKDDPDLVSRLLADPEFEVLLEIKYIALEHTALEYEPAMQAMNDIIDAIDESLQH